MEARIIQYPDIPDSDVPEQRKTLQTYSDYDIIEILQNSGPYLSEVRRSGYLCEDLDGKGQPRQGWSSHDPNHKLLNPSIPAELGAYLNTKKPTLSRGRLYQKPV